MDRNYLAGPSMALQSQLLLGCSHEAERADTVAQVLDGLRTALDESFYWHLTDLTTEIRQSSRLLRDLTARSHAHLSRTAIVADHLNIMLACMSRTLRDITAHYEDKTISRENRWKKMYHDMLKEAGGLPLRQRFVLYNDFLILVLYKVTRDKRFEPTLLEQLRTKILDLRRKRNIPDPPPPIAPAMAVVTASAGADQLVQQPRAGALAVPTHVLREHVHWCERVFALPLPAQIDTGLDERIEVNVPMVSVLDPRRPRGNVVMRRSYDNNRFCAKFIVAWNEEPFVVLRMYQGMSLVAWRAHDDLIASREGNAVLLRRWSQSRGGWKEWARFAFVHWEELVLFYTAFFVLKARNPLAAVRPSEYGLADEETLFKAKIIDDGYQHTLMINLDRRNAGVRLLTAVGDGELRKCPVWTAFVPARLLHLRRLLVRETGHIVLVTGIHLYIFCQDYRESKMRRGKSGPFEIIFQNEEDANRFVETLRDLQQALEPPDAQECIAGPSYAS